MQTHLMQSPELIDIEAIKMDLSDTDIQMLFDRFDPDGDGDMELGELLDALEAEPDEYPEGEEPESLGDEQRRCANCCPA